MQEEFEGTNYTVKASNNGLTIHKRFSPGASVINIPATNIGSIEYSSYRIIHAVAMLAASVAGFAAYFLGYLKQLQAYSLYLLGAFGILAAAAIPLLWWNHKMGKLIIMQIGRQEPIVVKIDKKSADRIVQLVERI